MQKLTVYDPPMCCSTGVCGPEIDPKLARFAGDLTWLEEQGIKVERLNLAQEPERFVENAAVKAILERSEDDELPVIVVNDAVFVSGRYPDRDELAACVGLASEAAGSAFNEQVAELIALGAAIGASCEPCFKFHYDKARKLGVTTEDMREAVRIGEAVKAGSAKHILGVADRLIGDAGKVSDAKACCEGSKAPEQKTSGCC